MPVAGIEDVSRVDFADQMMALADMIPPLTTVRQPVLEMGHAAAPAILAFINGQTPTLTLFDTELIIRESVTAKYSPPRIQKNKNWCPDGLRPRGRAIR